MSKDLKDNSVSLYDLSWDTEYFGVKSGKVILHKPLTINEWLELKPKLNEFEFVSIENSNSEPINAQFIGKDTSAFLADTNIQLIKKLTFVYKTPNDNVDIYQSLEKNDQILELADFQFSKFIEDPNLATRKGAGVYRQWLINSFDNPGKYYALSKDNNGDIDGFLLHSYSENECVIELIAVSKAVTQNGVGTRLFNAVEYTAHQKGFTQLKVGTQLRNLGAINFYHKVGCRQIGCHQIFHLWNI